MWIGAFYAPSSKQSMLRYIPEMYLPLKRSQSRWGGNISRRHHFNPREEQKDESSSWKGWCETTARNVELYAVGKAWQRSGGKWNQLMYWSYWLMINFLSLIFLWWHLFCSVSLRKNNRRDTKERLAVLHGVTGAGCEGNYLAFQEAINETLYPLLWWREPGTRNQYCGVSASPLLSVQRGSVIHLLSLSS